jgi:hypothetical protein
MRLALLKAGDEDGCAETPGDAHHRTAQTRLKAAPALDDDTRLVASLLFVVSS